MIVNENNSMPYMKSLATCLNRMVTDGYTEDFIVTELLFMAWKVLMQIRAHSSTILVTFLERVALKEAIVVRRSSQWTQALKQAWEWLLVMVMISF